MLRLAVGEGRASRKSPRLTIPSRFPLPSTTGKRRIRKRIIMSYASATGISGPIVLTGEVIQSLTSIGLFMVLSSERVPGNEYRVSGLRPLDTRYSLLGAAQHS